MSDPVEQHPPDTVPSPPIPEDMRMFGFKYPLKRTYPAIILGTALSEVEQGDYNLGIFRYALIRSTWSDMDTVPPIPKMNFLGDRHQAFIGTLSAFTPMQDHRPVYGEDRWARVHGAHIDVALHYDQHRAWFRCLDRRQHDVDYADVSLDPATNPHEIEQTLLRLTWMDLRRNALFFLSETVIFYQRAKLCLLWHPHSSHGVLNCKTRGQIMQEIIMRYGISPESQSLVEDDTPEDEYREWAFQTLKDTVHWTANRYFFEYWKQSKILQELKFRYNSTYLTQRISEADHHFHVINHPLIGIPDWDTPIPEAMLFKSSITAAERASAAADPPEFFTFNSPAAYDLTREEILRQCIKMGLDRVGFCEYNPKLLEKMKDTYW